MGQYLFRHEGMDSRWLVPIRLGGAGIILLIFSFMHYGAGKTMKPWTNRRDAIDLMIYGILGVSCCQLTYFLTIQLSDAGVATIMQELAPAVIMVIMCIRQRRAPGLRELSCVVLAVAGIVLITTRGDFGSLSVSGYAVITGLISALCVVIYNMYPRRLLLHYPVPLMQAWAFMMGSILFSAIFRPWTIAYRPGTFGLFGIAFVILVGNVAAFTLFMSGVKYIGPESAVLYGFSEPIIAAILTVVLFDTPFTLAGAAGFVMVFIMLAILSLPEKAGKEEYL